MAIADYQTKIEDRLRDQEAKVTTTQRDNALGDAVREYSKRKPDIKVEDVAGDGTRLLSLPASWDDDFSVIRSIEYPIGSIPPTLFDSHDFYTSPSETKIQTPSAVANAENARIKFTIRHVVSGAADTIPVDDLEPVCNYAAAVLFDELAAAYSGDQDSTIPADSVDHQSKAEEFRRQASNLRKRFYDQIGVDPKKNVAAGTVVNLDMLNSQGNDRLTHSNRYR